MASQRTFREIGQPLGLKAGFSFAEFRERTPLDERNVWELLLERHQERLTVKRAGKALDNLRRLFEATFRLANKVGFVSMTLRDLSRETGMSMGGLYGYISSKDDIADMIEDMVQLLVGTTPAWYVDIPSPAERLEATLRGHVFLTELLQPWFYFVFMESRVLSSAQRHMAKTAEMQFHADLVARLLAAGVPHEAQAQLLASHSSAMVQDWVVKRWKYRQLGIEAEAFAASVSSHVLERAGSLKRC